MAWFNRIVAILVLVTLGFAAHGQRMTTDSGETVSPDQRYEEFLRGGAERISTAQIRRDALRAPRQTAAIIECGLVACYCEGALSCADMISQCSGDYFHCLPGPEGPVCVCTK